MMGITTKEWKNWKTFNEAFSILHKPPIATKNIGNKMADRAQVD